MLRSNCAPKTPDAKKYDELYAILKQQFTPLVITFREFHNATKSDAQTIAEWYAQIKTLAMECAFGDHLEAFLVDEFVIGLTGKIFEKLYEEDEKLTLENAYKIALRAEVKYMIQGRSEVNFVRNKSQGNSSSRGSAEDNKSKRSKCKHCGWTNHTSEKCKFKDASCNKCKKTGHLASICQSKSKDVIFVDSDNFLRNSNLNSDHT